MAHVWSQISFLQHQALMVILFTIIFPKSCLGGDLFSCDIGNNSYSASSVGCIDYTVTSAVDCQGEWLIPASNQVIQFLKIFQLTNIFQTSCFNHKYGCHNQPGWPETTPKTESVCQECGGTYGPYFSWTPGNWIQGTVRNFFQSFFLNIPQVRPLQWIPRSYGPQFTWNTTLDFLKLSNIYFEAVSSEYSLIVKTDAEVNIIQSSFG